MQVHHRAAALRTALAAERQSGHDIAFVPTMGNLHAGHIAVVRAAKTPRASAWSSAASSNPKQFEPGEDFERYPRTPERDHELLRSQGVGYLFSPDVDEFYPAGEARPHRRVGTGAVRHPVRCQTP